jgi:hypothetical protein
VLGSPGECDDGGAGRGGFAVPYIGEEREAGVGETFGELSFFTEIPQMTTVRWAAVRVGCGIKCVRRDVGRRPDFGCEALAWALYSQGQCVSAVWSSRAVDATCTLTH